MDAGPMMYNKPGVWTTKHIQKETELLSGFIKTRLFSLMHCLPSIIELYKNARCRGLQPRYFPCLSFILIFWYRRTCLTWECNSVSVKELGVVVLLIMLVITLIDNACDNTHYDTDLVRLVILCISKCAFYKKKKYQWIRVHLNDFTLKSISLSLQAELLRDLQREAEWLTGPRPLQQREANGTSGKADAQLHAFERNSDGLAVLLLH